MIVMKKNYLTPGMCVVRIQHRSQILIGSNDVQSFSSNVTLDYGGDNGSETPRVKETNIWDEEW